MRKGKGGGVKGFRVRKKGTKGEKRRYRMIKKGKRRNTERGQEENEKE